jgi:uncharacterized membrane protein YdjX (TVP38/TMEM64 family)
VTDLINQLFRDWGELTLGSGFALATIFAIAAFVIFPRTILILTAGATFGFKVFPFVLLGSVTGSILAFLLARHVAANWVQARIARYPLLHTVANVIDEEGWRIIALLRLGAPIPSSLQNYALGLTHISVKTYSLATLFFSIPQIALFSFMGASGRASVLEDGASTASRIFLLAGIALAAALIWLIGVRVRQALNGLSDRTRME